MLSRPLAEFQLTQSYWTPSLHPSLPLSPLLSIHPFSLPSPLLSSPQLGPSLSLAASSSWPGRSGARVAVATCPIPITRWIASRLYLPHPSHLTAQKAITKKNNNNKKNIKTNLTHRSSESTQPNVLLILFCARQNHIRCLVF